MEAWNPTGKTNSPEKRWINASRGNFVYPEVVSLDSKTEKRQNRALKIWVLEGFSTASFFDFPFDRPKGDKRDLRVPSLAASRPRIPQGSGERPAPG